MIRSRMASKSQRSGGIVINANTVIGIIGSLITTLIGAVLIWLVTGALQSAKDNTTKLTELKFEVPAVAKEVGEVKNTVGDIGKKVDQVEKVMVTRDELNRKQERTEKIVQEVRDEQKNVREELRRFPANKTESE